MESIEVLEITYAILSRAPQPLPSILGILDVTLFWPRTRAMTSRRFAVVEVEHSIKPPALVNREGG